MQKPFTSFVHLSTDIINRYLLSSMYMSGFIDHKVWHGSPCMQNAVSPGSTGSLELNLSTVTHQPLLVGAQSMSIVSLKQAVCDLRCYYNRRSGRKEFTSGVHLQRRINEKRRKISLALHSTMSKDLTVKISEISLLYHMVNFT